MDCYLETARLILRRFTADDVDALYDLDADPAVTRYINGGRPTPREQVRDELLPAGSPSTTILPASAGGRRSRRRRARSWAGSR
ncbi:GNAT family N-acetyltransferase [Catellatospora coxensis]